MTYAVKEMFKTLQGEGAHTGRPALFVRFSGCNLWSGRQEDRASGCSAWCDTEFRGTDGENGGRYHAAQLAAKAGELWGTDRKNRFAVLTGGEPMLQVDHLLIDNLHRFDFEVAIETNGTREVPGSADWVTVSPKAGTEIVQRTGQELKLVFPQEGIDPAAFEPWAFSRFYLQPMDGPNREANTKAAIAYCLDHPKWRLSVQSHKFIGVR